MVKRLGGALVFAAAVVACGSSSSRSGFEEGQDPTLGGGADNAGNAGGLGQPAGENPRADECQKMDLVFVVDDSGSMKEEQDNLAANFPKFVKVLDDFRTKSGAKIDYRVAVTTTGRDLRYTIQTPIGAIAQNEKGDNGAFREKASCGSTRRWLERGDGDVAKNFACLSKVGTGGASIEMPLYALKLALEDRVADGTNAGFRRPDALLGVVILSDEDDCSREDNDFTVANDSCDTMPNLRSIDDYAGVLDNAAGGPGRWAAAVIAGESSCESSFGKAIEAKRLKKFTQRAGKNGTFSSICDGDLAPGLQKALDTFDAACKNFPGPR